MGRKMAKFTLRLVVACLVVSCTKSGDEVAAEAARSEQLCKAAKESRKAVAIRARELGMSRADLGKIVCEGRPLDQMMPAQNDFVKDRPSDKQNRKELGATPQDKKIEGSARTASNFRDRPIPVAVARVKIGRVDAFYASSASLQAEEEASVVARTEGIVKELFVEEGDNVTLGSHLAQLDTRRLELEVARTRKNIESFERAYLRAKQLYESKMISPDAYDQAVFSFEREEASLNLQLYELEEATIKAPIEGFITTRHIKLGNTLRPGDLAFEIKRAAVIEAVINVPEKEMLKLRKRQLALASVDALGGSQFEGIVDRVSPEVDSSTGTFRVTISLENKDNRLKPGMFARIKVRYDSKEKVLLLRRDAVVTQNNESAVFVVKAGRAMRQAVDLGYVMGDEVEVLNGLSDGDQVVISGQGGLRDRALVRVVSP